MNLWAASGVGVQVFFFMFEGLPTYFQLNDVSDINNFGEAKWPSIKQFRGLRGFIRTARLQNKIAPETFLNRYEKWFGKRGKGSEKRSETCPKILKPPSRRLKKSHGTFLKFFTAETLHQKMYFSPRGFAGEAMLRAQVISEGEPNLAKSPETTNVYGFSFLNKLFMTAIAGQFGVDILADLWPTSITGKMVLEN